MLPKFKNVRHRSTSFFSGEGGGKNLNHIPTIWRCASNFLLKFKMAATDQLHIFVGAKTLPNIWKCEDDFAEI